MIDREFDDDLNGFDSFGFEEEIVTPEQMEKLNKQIQELKNRPKEESQESFQPLNTDDYVDLTGFSKEVIAKMEEDSKYNYLNDEVVVGTEAPENRGELSIKDLYPPVIERYLQELSDKSGKTLEGFVAAMPTIFGALGGHSQYFNDANGTFKGKPGAWIILEGDTSAGKSLIMKNLQSGLEAVDELEREEYKKAMADYDNAKVDYDEALKERRRRPVDQRGDLPPKPEKPISKKVMVSSTTGEALQSALSASNQILLCKDEFASLLEDFEKYSKGGWKQDFMSLFSNERISISRKTADEIFCKMPNISVLGGCTNSTLSRLLRAENEEDGFLQRFLVYTIAPEEEKETNYEDFDTTLTDAYKEFCKGMYSEEALIVTFDQSLRKNFLDLLKIKNLEKNFEEMDTKFLGKVAQHACKISLGIKLAWNHYYKVNPSEKPSSWNNEIMTDHDFERGWRLVKHFTNLLNERRKNIITMPETARDKQEAIDREDADEIHKKTKKKLKELSKSGKTAPGITVKDGELTMSIRKVVTLKWARNKSSIKSIRKLIESLEERGLVKINGDIGDKWKTFTLINRMEQ